MVKAKCKYNMGYLLKFYLFVLHKIRMDILYALLLLLNLIIIYGGYLGSGWSYIKQNTAYIIISTIFFLWIALVYFYIIPKYQLKQRTREFKDAFLYYEFGYETFTEKTHSGRNSEETSLEYTKLYRAFETKKYFILLRNSTVGYMIKKTDIYEGTPKELSCILEKHLGKKFKEYI